MTAVCTSALKGPDSSDLKESQLKLRVDLFHKYLDHQPTRELQALFALQALIVKLNHPPGLLRKFFDVLYDEDIICEDSFYLWNNDTTDMQGKDEARESVQPFFNGLVDYDNYDDCDDYYDYNCDHSSEYDDDNF